MKRIPNILHYCFGFDRTFGGKPWSLVHHVCVKSAIERIKPEQAFLYYEYEPNGVWWELTRKILTPIRIKAPRDIFGNALEHPAHCADVVRLRTLIDQGGVYLDADVLVHNNFDHLLDNSVVLGAEGVNAEYGLANAVIIAEPGAPFLKKWYEEYRWFRSRGRDEYWNEHSVRVPLTLSKAHPNEITILPHTAFYWPLWAPEHLNLIYGSPPPSEARGTLANHLWESNAWETYLEHLTPGKVRGIDSNFHRWARPYVENLPNQYGSPSMLDMYKRSNRIQKRRFVSRMVQLRYKLGRARRLGLLGVASYVTERILSSVSERWHRRRIFSKIYERKLWGDDKESKFYSGIGSRGVVAATYVERVSELLCQHASNLGRTITVIDLGCGDFEIGSQLVANVRNMNYIGCDIVPELIAHHKRSVSDARIEFKTLDIVADDLPPGDVCLIRQVLQHLSNSDIKRLLTKLRNFHKVYITEGYPVVIGGPVNPDKRVGSDVRFDWRIGSGRGVELDKEPFRLPIREVCRVEVSHPPHIIITWEVDCFTTTLAD